MKKQANKFNLKFTYLLWDKNKCYLPFLIRRLSSLRAQISYQANRCSPSLFNSQGHRLSSAVRSDMLWPRRHENNPRFKKLVPIFENRFKSTAKNLWWTTQRATRLNMQIALFLQFLQPHYCRRNAKSDSYRLKKCLFAFIVRWISL